MSRNRYIVECKAKWLARNFHNAAGRNRYIVECKVVAMAGYCEMATSRNRYIVECKDRRKQCAEYTSKVEIDTLWNVK